MRIKQKMGKNVKNARKIDFYIFISFTAFFAILFLSVPAFLALSESTQFLISCAFAIFLVVGIIYFFYDGIKSYIACKEYDNVLFAAEAMSLTDIPDEWKSLIKTDWKIKKNSCSCGGQYTWFKPRPSGGYEMHGCVCHNTPS